LLAKRALNPAKFDRTYPNIGRLLARDERLRAANNSGPLNGLLYPSAYHNYLQWRRGLDPVRFDYYHPVLGAILAEDQRIRDLVATNNPSTPTNPSAGELTPPDTTPTVPGIPAGGDEGGGPPPGIPAGGSDGGGPPGTGINPPGIITITAVPEPRSIVLVLLGAIVLVGRSARRAGQRRGAIAAAD